MNRKIYSEASALQMNRAIRLSFYVGVAMLLLKFYAYYLTGSAAILSDLAEAVVHVFAVGFAAYSMWLSHKPADEDHTYGHDRITFFSAGFEGALIMIAAVYIIYQAAQKILYGFSLENLDMGMLFISIATMTNGILGLYLIRRGKKFHSLVLEADGKHILTDCLTSLGVIIALILTKVTGWIYFDPLIALLIGCNILWTGSRLIYNSFQGLMDRANPEEGRRIQKLLREASSEHGILFHHLRYRNAGNRLMIEVHLMFPSDMHIITAHEIATIIEHKMESAFDKPTELVTHLEPIEGHDEVHARMLGREG